MKIKSNKPKWKIIHDSLLHEIKRFNVGDNFYTIDEIARNYNVSRITAIKVLEEFAQKGLVEKIRRKGTIVKKSSAVKLKIYLVIPAYASTNIYLNSPIGMKLYSGLVLAIGEIGAGFSVVSEKMLYSLSDNFLDGDSGIIFFQRASRETTNIVRQRGIPYIFLHPPGTMNMGRSVRVNIRYGGYLATKHLVDSGHKKIGFVCEGLASPYILPRFKGYVKTLKQSEIKFSWNYVKEISEEHNPADEFILEELFSITEPPTGIVASSDKIAMNILEYCENKGIRVPDDISIVGYDNLDESGMTEPALTTVETYLEHAGRKSVFAITQMIRERYNNNDDNKRKDKDIVITPKLIVRNSTQARTLVCNT